MAAVLMLSNMKKYNKGSHKIPSSPKEPKCPFHKQSLSWSSASKAPTSSSKVSTMNRSMVQPWDPPSVPSQPNCSWKSLKPNPSNQPHTPSLLVRFVDDTLVIQEAEHSQQFLQHINSQEPNIQFTVKEPGTDGSIPFLDTKVKPGPNNTVHTTVYRKPTHTDQYLHWDSNHFITAENNVQNTLAHRVKVVSNTTEDLNKEMEHLNKALKDCHFPNWELKQITTSVSTKTQPQQH